MVYFIQEDVYTRAETQLKNKTTVHFILFGEDLTKNKELLKNSIAREEVSEITILLFFKDS